MSTKSIGPIRTRKGNLAVRTAARLRDAILRGEYAIGQPLRELELAKALGISRVPVREALNRLAAEGLVTLRPNRGALVARISESDLREIAEACRLLEAHLLKLAVPVMTPDVVARAAACLDELDRIDDAIEWSRGNWRFHTTLYGPAQRPLLVELLGSLRDRAERAMLILVAEKERRVALNREHRAILESARGGHAARAAKLLDAHLSSGKDAVLRLIEPG